MVGSISKNSVVCGLDNKDIPANKEQGKRENEILH